MRVLNDREEKSTVAELGILEFLTFGLLCGFGFGTVLFGPLPVIVAHLRFPQPWPRLMTLSGVILAAALFQRPTVAMAVLFVVSLVSAEVVTNNGTVKTLLTRAVLVSCVCFLGVILIYSGLYRVSLPALPNVWFEQSLRSFEATQGGLSTDVIAKLRSQWEESVPSLPYLLPFIVASFSALSVWVSVGTGAHLGWIGETFSLSANHLRMVRLKWWPGFLLVLSFAATLLLPIPLSFIGVGCALLSFVLLFIEGSVILSRLFFARGTPNISRTVVYFLSGLFGCTILLGLFGSAFDKFMTQRPLLGGEHEGDPARGY